MYDDDTDMDGLSEDPLPTKTVLQSIWAIAITLALGAGVVSLFLIHYVASEIGFLIWAAVTMGPGLAAAYNLDKHLMVGFHIWARLIVGVVIFFSVALVIAASLEAQRF